MSIATTVYQLCTSCAVAVAYTDFTALDTEGTATVLAFMAETGYLVPAEDIDPPGYWLCECCGIDQLGAGRAVSNRAAGSSGGRGRALRAGERTGGGDR